MEEEQQQDNNLIPSEDETIDYEDPAEEQEGVKYTKAQKVISQAIPLLPGSIIAKMKKSQNSLTESCKALIEYIKAHPQLEELKQVGGADLKAKTELRKAIMELLWTAETLFNNFKINAKSQIFSESILLGVKALHHPLEDLDVSSKIVTILTKFPLYHIDLTQSIAYATETGLWRSVYELFYESFVLFKRSEVGLSLVQKFKLKYRGLLRSLNGIFVNDFAAIYAKIKENGINFLNLDTNSTNKNFMDLLIPMKSLPLSDLLIVLKDFHFLRQNVSKQPTLPIKLYFKLSYNDDYFLSDQDIKILKRAILNINESLKGTKVKRKTKVFYGHCIGKIFGNYLLKKNNTKQQYERLLELIEGTLQIYINEMHPKEKGSVLDEVIRYALVSFTDLFTRKIFFVKDLEIRERAVGVFETCMKDVVNFGIFRNDWLQFDKILLALCAFDRKRFAGFILERLKLGLEQDEFKKLKLLDYLSKIVGIVCEEEDLAEALYWIVPKMLQRLEDTSDQGEITKIAEVLNNIFEYFISAEDSSVNSDFAHLIDIKDDIDESAIRFFNLYLKKGQDFQIHTIKSILYLGDFVLDKIFSKFKKDIITGYSTLHNHNVQVLISALYKLRKDQTEEVLVNWLNKSVWKKLSQPKAVDDLKLGVSLKIYGINEIEYRLKSENEDILIKQISVANAFLVNSLRLDEEVLVKLIKFIALTFETDKRKVVEASIFSLECLMSLGRFRVYGSSSKSYIKRHVVDQKNQEYGPQGLEIGQKFSKHLEYVTGEELNYPRLKKLFEAFLVGGLQSVENYLNLLAQAKAGDNPTAEIDIPGFEESVIDVYKQSIKQKDQEAQEGEMATETPQPDSTANTNDPNIEKLCNVLQMVNGLVNSEYFVLQLLKSKLYCSLIDRFKRLMLGFLKRTGLYESERIKETFLYFFCFESRKAEELLHGEQKVERYLIKDNLFYNSAHRFNLQSVQNQLDFARTLSKKYNRISSLLAAPVGPDSGNTEQSRSPFSIFDKILQNNDYLQSLDLRPVETPSVPREHKYYVFRNQFNDYLINTALLKSFFQLSPIIVNYNVNIKYYLFISNLLNLGPFFKPEKLITKAYDLVLDLLDIECEFETDYTHIVNKVIIVIISYFGDRVTTIQHKDQMIRMVTAINDKANKSKSFFMITTIAQFIISMFEYQGDAQGEEASEQLVGLIQDLDNLADILNQDLTNLLVLLSNLVTLSKIYEADAEFLKSALYNLTSYIHIKDITKRLLLCIGIAFIQHKIDLLSLKKETEYIHPVDELVDEQGYILEATTQEVAQEMKKRLGFAETGSEDLNIQKLFERVDQTFCPVQETGYLRLPLSFTKFAYTLHPKIANFEGAELDNIVSVAKKLFENLITESRDMDKKAYKSLAVKHDLIYKFLAYAPKFKNSLNDTTLVFRETLIGLFKNFGFEFYQKLKGIFEEFKEDGEANHLTGVRKYEQEFFSMALHTAGLCYTDEQFLIVAKDAVEVFKSFMSKLHVNIETVTRMRFTWALKISLNAGRLRQVLGLINEAYNSLNETENKSMMINLYTAYLIAAKNLTDQQTKDQLKRICQFEELKDLNDYQRAGLLLIVLQQSSTGDSFSLDKLRGRAQDQVNSVDDLARELDLGNNIHLGLLAKTDQFDPTEISLNFLKLTQSKTVMIRLSVIKSFAMIFMAGNQLLVTKESIDTIVEMMRLFISIDSNEKDSDQGTIIGVQPFLQMILARILIKEEVYDDFLDKFEALYAEISGKDKQYLFTLAYCMFTEGQLTNKRIDFLAHVLGTISSNIAEKANKATIFTFSRQTNTDLDEKTDYIVDKITEIEKTKENDEIIAGYGIVLMNFVTLKKWVLGSTVEKALRGIFKNRKGSKLLKKKFDYFISDFWKKRTANVELSRYQIPEDIQEELRDYRVVYSYFS